MTEKPDMALPTARATAATQSNPTVSSKAGIANAEFPIWAVEIYGFGSVFVEAPTAASARWFAASKCHEAGYGQSPIELIQRGVVVEKASSREIECALSIMKVERAK